MKKCSYVIVCIIYLGQALNNWDVDIKLGEKHGIDSNSQLSQDALLKIISGAERGDKDNLYFLGLLKLYGITVTKDYIGAAQNFYKAAQLGHSDAQTAFGVMKMKGIGLTQDYIGAVEWFRKSVEHDDSNGMWLLGTMLLEGKGVSTPNYHEAFMLLEKAASRHIPQAEHSLAMMYEYGLGIGVNFEKAMEYYRRAANQNNLESMYNLALMYAFGRGIPQDYVRALTLFDSAAVLSHAPSCYYMGVMKMNGHGSSIDYVEALAWFERAAAMDDYRISDKAKLAAIKLENALADADEVNNKILDRYARMGEVGGDL